MLQAIKENKAPHKNNQDKITILSVEDDRLEQAFLKAQILDLGHMVIQASDGQEAMKILHTENTKIDVILMDRLMPHVDGLTAVKEIKKQADFKNIPIVMVTAATTPSDIQQGIDAGVFYYLNKPVDPDVLKSVLTAAIHEVHKERILSSELKKHKQSFSLIEYAKFNFNRLEQAESLAAFLALCFPHPNRALTGLAELLINAVEHGNLEISYAEKTALMKNGRWHKEVLKREEMPEYKDRSATAILKRKEDGVYVVITDEGSGFDWKKYLVIDPSRAGHTHGRGIARAKNSCFDRLTYNESGNQVIAFMAVKDTLEW